MRRRGFDYACAWVCGHPENARRTLPNHETACDACVSVVIRADGKPAMWGHPPPRLVVVKDLDRELDRVLLGVPPPSAAFEDVPMGAERDACVLHGGCSHEVHVPYACPEPGCLCPFKEPLPEYPSGTDEKGTGDA